MLANPNLAIVAKKIPKAKVCLFSALDFHEMTTEISHEVHIALPRTCRDPRLDHPPIKVYRFSGESLTKGIEKHEVGGVEVRISSAERAILEYLYDVPRHEGFDEANYIIEGLGPLRPNVLQGLLEACNSVRVKRLFMYMAEHHQHSWLKRLDSSKIDFGKGKREILKGGKLNKKYKIVVPELSREDQ